MRINKNLSFLTSASAGVLDSHINNWRVKKKEYYYIREFAKELDKISKEGLGVTDLVIFKEVIWPNDSKGKKNDDIYLQINLLAKDLACFREFPKEKQEELKDVCGSLSTKIMYYEEICHNFFNQD